MRTLDLPVKKGEKIEHIERYAGFIELRYTNSVDFIHFDKMVLVDVIQKIALSDEILNVAQDLAKVQYLFV